MEMEMKRQFGEPNLIRAPVIASILYLLAVFSSEI